jgi:hypothetical protein
MEKYLLGLERAAPWEAITSTGMNINSVNCLGGLSSDFGAIPGTVPARIYKTAITAPGITVNEIWAGFRTGRFGTLANFVSPWEAEACSVLGTDATKTNDTTATPGGAGQTRVGVSFATSSSMVNRLHLLASDISLSNYMDLRGTFDILVRAKVDSGVTSVLRLDNGLYSSTSGFAMAQQGENVTVTSTSWFYYNLGRITWPPLERPSQLLTVYSMYGAALRLMAQRTAGSNGLYIDHFVPLPVAEGSMHLSSLNWGLTTPSVQVRVSPVGHLDAIGYEANYPAYYATTHGTSGRTWRLPNTSGGKLVTAVNVSSPTLTDEINFQLSYFPRFKTMRGSA